MISSLRPLLSHHNKKHRRAVLAALFVFCIFIVVRRYSFVETTDQAITKEKHLEDLQVDRFEHVDHKTAVHLQQPSSFGNDAAVKPDILKWITQLMNKHNPQIPYSSLLTQYLSDEPAKQRFISDTDHIFSKQYLSSLLRIPDSTKEKLQTSHKSLMQTLNSIPAQFTTFGSTDPAVKQGIVFVGGGKFSWLVLIIIEQLRQNCRTELPIEVFIPTVEEYEPYYCDVVLPKYGAKCTMFFQTLAEMFDIISEENQRPKEQSIGGIGYRFKILAILASKFEDMLLLDADNAPLFDPAELFQQPVYQETNMIIWPDPWSRTTNPAFYDITGLKVSNEIVRGAGSKLKTQEETDLYYDTNVTYHDLNGTLPNPSSESGMLLVNKRTHLKTLLLALYYNLYGPGLYYPLLTQGAAGEGDKETFIASVVVAGEPYHQIQSLFAFIGWFDRNGGFNSKALGQRDPQQDYLKLKDPRIFFMHLSYPKLIPQLLFNDAENKGKSGELNHFDQDKQEWYKSRLYLSSTRAAGYDFELKIFENTWLLMCGGGRDTTTTQQNQVVTFPGVAKNLKFFEGLETDLDNWYCPLLKEHVIWLREHPEE
ncbi:hypothetical protein WICPIJ_001871 [Wickerhamomyces pijperi]|uniref:Glycosyltransferase family 71 protein n=1 Tax=Wickerhamomyces pijperi TaxID=599730 RepID=A0A9P8TQR1_WICPI|nr:hypothetical protein WICPIJ_001871 [Wickerhamomyces pijperi]